MQKLFIKIKGLTPILMNNPIAMENEGPLPTPDKEAEISRYVKSDGTLYVPSIALRKSIILGATSYKIGKFSLKSRLSAAIQLFDEYLDLIDGKGKPMKEYTIDRRRVVIQRAGILRSRARIDCPWFVEGILGFNADLIKNKHGQVEMDILKDAVNIAGQVSGLLDFRPNRGGWFGKYELVDINIEE